MKRQQCSRCGQFESFEVVPCKNGHKHDWQPQTLRSMFEPESVGPTGAEAGTTVGISEETRVFAETLRQLMPDQRAVGLELELELESFRMKAFDEGMAKGQVECEAQDRAETALNNLADSASTRAILELQRQDEVTDEPPTFLSPRSIAAWKLKQILAEPKLIDVLPGMKTRTRRDDQQYPAELKVYFDDQGVGFVVIKQQNRYGTIEFYSPSKGGRSPRTRTAILLLALAVDLDNEENPQPGMSR